MARGKQKDRKAPKGKPASGGRTYTPEQLVEQANVALGNMELELAAEFYNRALEMSPNDTNIMDALADVKMQLGDTEKALELLLTSTIMAPNVNPFKWLFLGQMQFEFDAVNSYRKGIQILTQQLKTETDPDTRAMISKQIAKAHCSIAEIYLTDLCYEENAEQTCEAEVTAAHQACPTSLDAQQTLASLRLSQNRKAEAGDIITAVCDQLMRIRAVVAKRTVVEEMSGADEPAEFQDLPEMAFSIATLKILIECASDAHHTALYVRAQELGSGLLEEDDDNIELWYLMGVACMGGVDGCANSGTATAGTGNTAAGKERGAKKGGKKTAAPVAQDEALQEATDLPAAQFHFETALEMMNKLKEQLREQEGPDAQFPYQEHYDLVQEHLALIAAASGADPNSTGALAGSKAASAMPVDEEWSEGEEEDGMAVDK